MYVCKQNISFAMGFIMIPYVFFIKNKSMYILCIWIHDLPLDGILLKCLLIIHNIKKTGIQ